MKHNVWSIALGAGIVGGVLLLTTANVGKASATDGGTTLSGAACSTPVTAQAYDIDFGTFLASDVYGTSKNNAGTKTAGGGGISRTPTSGSGGADFYVYASNPCVKVEWVIQVIASGMTGVIGGTPIPASALLFSGANHIYRFNNSPANPQINYFPKDTNLSTAQTVMNHGGINNGIAGDYGVLLTHAIVIPANTAVSVYTGIFTVTCLAC